MALYKLADFAKRCGVANSYIKTYTNRNKLFTNEEGYYDDKNPYNKDFLVKCLNKQAGIKPDKPPVKPEKKSKEKPVDEPDLNINPPVDDQEAEIAEEDISKMTPYQVDRAIKRQELLKKQAETRLLNLREEKIRGETIPIELAKQIIGILSKSIITAQKESIEAILINISKETRLSGEQTALLRGKMIKNLNDGVDRSLVVAEKSIQVLVSEYSLKREVGEHD